MYTSPIQQNDPHCYDSESLLIYPLFCWSLKSCLLASLCIPVQSTVNLSESTAMEALLYLRSLDLASQISVLPLLLPLVPMCVRTPGSRLVHFTSQPGLLGRSATFAALPSLLPASGHICLPKAEWDLSSAVALRVHSLFSPDRQDPKLCRRVQNTGVTVVVQTKKICFARGEN